MNNISYPSRIEFFNVALGERRADGRRGEWDCFVLQGVNGSAEYLGERSGLRAGYEQAIVFRDRWAKDAEISHDTNPLFAQPVQVQVPVPIVIPKIFYIAVWNRAKGLILGAT